MTALHPDTPARPDRTSSTDPRLFTNHNHTLPTTNDQPTLHITSFGRRIGPLLPPPDIAFDIRALPNPPKSIRVGHTGLSKPLRDAFFADERVQRRFHEICARIRDRLVLAEVEQAGAGARRELRVGVCCDIGRNRSVAFVEELGRVRFEGWNVVIGHRDVHRGSSSKKSGQSSHHRTDYADGT